MAKHRRKNHDPAEGNNAVNNNNNNMPQNPFGIDPFQLMNLLGGNIDINSIGNMLSSMNTNGFNLGSLEQIANMAGINLNGMNNNGLNNMMNNSSTGQNIHNNETLNNDEIENVDINMDINKKESSKKRIHKREEKTSDEDENLIFLRQLQSYIHPEKKEFIDRIIKVYCEGKI